MLRVHFNKLMLYLDLSFLVPSSACRSTTLHVEVGSMRLPVRERRTSS